MCTRQFEQVDVFGENIYEGNPLAVVVNSEGLTLPEMKRFSLWTNLSETVFLLPPTSTEADYKVRIFTPTEELPFAGHPTLGACHAFINYSKCEKEVIVQECGVGLITIRKHTVVGARGEMKNILSFAAPALLRSGVVEDSVRHEVLAALQLQGREELVVDIQYADNGPGWILVLLRNVDALLQLSPLSTTKLCIGCVSLYPSANNGNNNTAIEVRAFYPGINCLIEDPVTGSLNASIGQYLFSKKLVPFPYVASQGQCIGFKGRVYVHEVKGQIFIGGETRTCISGTVTL